MNGRKSQISLIVALGLSILLILSFMGYFKYMESRQDIAEVVDMTSTVQSMKDYIAGCVKDIEPPVTMLLGLQGGYLNAPSGSFPIELGIEVREGTVKNISINVPYYFFEGSSKIPSLDAIEDLYSQYIENSLAPCLDSLSAFQDRGLEVSTGNLDVKTTLTEGNAVFRISYPVKIRKEGKELGFSDVAVRVPSRLYSVYGIAAGIVAHQVKEPEGADLEFLLSQDVNVTFFTEGDTFVYWLVDDSPDINAKPLSFVFANKFKGVELK